MFDSIIKKMTWIDIKMAGIIGIAFGILLTQHYEWFQNLSWSWLVLIIVIGYAKIAQSMLKK